MEPCFSTKSFVGQDLLFDLKEISLSGDYVLGRNIKAGWKGGHSGGCWALRFSNSPHIETDNTTLNREDNLLTSLVVVLLTSSSSQEYVSTCSLHTFPST